MNSSEFARTSYQILVLYFIINNILEEIFSICILLTKYFLFYVLFTWPKLIMQVEMLVTMFKSTYIYYLINVKLWNPNIHSRKNPFSNPRINFV